MKNDDLFNYHTIHYGGKFHYKDNSICASLIKRYNFRLRMYSMDPALVRPFPNILVDFVDNDSFNAFAMKRGETYIIGINWSVLTILSDIFNRIMSHPHLMAEIGNSSLENNLDKIDDYFLDLKQLITNFKSGPDDIMMSNIPKDRIRAKYAHHLTVIAMDFIFEHELSHILFGHVDYLEKNHRLTIVKEFISEDKLRKNIDLQTLEMDADSTALARICINVFRTISKEIFFEIDSELQFLYNDYISTFSTIYFSLTTLYLVFGDSNYQFTVPGYSSHPPPTVRHLMIGSTFGSMIDKWNLNVSVDDFYEKIADGAKEAFKCYLEITNKKLNKEAYSKEFYQENPLFGSLLSHWSNHLRNNLLTYTYKPLAD